MLGPGEDAIRYRRAAPRNLDARKMIRSEPAFSDEEEDDNFQMIDEDFRIVEERDSAMEVEEEPPSLPAKKKGIFAIASASKYLGPGPYASKL